MKRDSITTQLEHKKGAYNLKEGIDILQNVASRRSVSSSKRSSINKSFGDQNQRISQRPITIITSLDQDILHFKEENFGLGKQQPDELLAIPILPADEMESLTYEIKQWTSNVKRVRMIFYCGLCCALALVVITSAFSTFWYNRPNAYQGLHYRPGTTDYNMHMCFQMITTLLLLVGTMLFRILPHTGMSKLVAMHAMLFQFSFAFCLFAVYLAVAAHEDFTENENHFYSLHSWLGWLAMGCYAICMVTGLLFLYYPTGTLRAHHSLYGKVTFALIGVTSITGYYERSLEYVNAHKNETRNISYTSVNVILVNTLGVLLLGISIFVRAGLANFRFRRQPKPQWDVIVFRSMHEIEDIFIEVYDRYDNFELWVRQVNQTKMGILQAVQAENMESISRRK